jgi:hypothetical protein
MVYCLAMMVALLPVSSVEAGIGETEEQLVARHGAVDARLPERMLEQGRIFILGERIVLKRAEWRVTAVLLEGRCAKITYGKSGAWTDSQYMELLARNAGGWRWNEILGGAPKWQRTWRREDGLVAKWMYANGFAIEGQPFVDARARARATVGGEPTAAAAR